MAEINQRGLDFNNKDKLEQEMTELSKAFITHYTANPLGVCEDGETNIKKCIKLTELMIGKLLSKFSKDNLKEINQLDAQYEKDKNSFTKKAKKKPKYTEMQTAYAIKRHNILMNEFYRHNIYNLNRKIILTI